MNILNGETPFKTGIRNSGTSCYINSVLQCLFADQELHNLFLHNADYTTFAMEYSEMSYAFIALSESLHNNNFGGMVSTSKVSRVNLWRYQDHIL